MTPRRAALWFGGSTLLAAWLAAAAAPSLAPESVAQAPSARMSEPDRKAVELATEAERLGARLSVVSSPRPMMRNPFLFASRVPKAVPSGPVGTLPSSGPGPAAAAPRISLLGVAEDVPGSSPVRTAIVSLAGELLLVKEGESIGAGRYRLTHVGADAIEIEDIVESRTIRIALP